MSTLVVHENLDSVLKNLATQTQKEG